MKLGSYGSIGLSLMLASLTKIIYVLDESGTR